MDCYNLFPGNQFIYPTGLVPVESKIGLKTMLLPNFPRDRAMDFWSREKLSMHLIVR